MDHLSLQIIELLRKNAYLTSDQAGKDLGVSERTIRSRIKEVNSELIRNGAVINSERGRGNHLEVIDPDLFSRFLQGMQDEKTEMPDTSEERVSFLIDYLLGQKDYVYIDDLCELLYVARNTMSSDLKKAEQELRKYRLKIQRRPNYGIRAEGKEEDKRLCITDHITHNDRFFRNKQNTKDLIESIGNALSGVFHRERYKISVDNYIILRYVVYTAYVRASSGFILTYSEEERKRLLQILPSGMCDLADQVLEALGEAYSILQIQDERLYLISQIAGRGALEGLQTPIQHPEADAVISRMLVQIKEELQLDFTGDEEVMTAMRNHLRAFDIRMRLRIPIENPALSIIKKKYSLAYAAAYYLSGSLAEIYDTPVSEDEIGYFAIIFAMALEKQKRPVRKKNVLVVCPAGSVLTQFFLRNYRDIFGEYVDHIYHCSAKEAGTFDYAGKKIDCCFTTVDISLNVPVPHYRISLFPSENEIQKFTGMFQETNRMDLMSFYDPALFIPHIHAASKEEAIHQITEHIAMHYKLPENFEALILEREKYGLTAFGNLVAMPHPSIACTEESIVSIAILDEQINWGSADVQVILIVSMAADEQRDFRTLIELTTEFVSDEEAVNKLIQNRTYDQLIRLLIDPNEH